MFGFLLAECLPDALVDALAFTRAFPDFEAETAKNFGEVTELEIRRHFPNAIVDIEDEAMDLSFGDPAVSDTNSLRMLYKVWRCNEIKRRQEHLVGRAFDVVVRMRPDVMPDIDAAFVKALADRRHDRVVYIPDADETLLWLDDVLAVSSSSVANDYAALFAQSLLKRSGGWSIIHRELASHLQSVQVSPKTISLRRPITEDSAFRQRQNADLLESLLDADRYETNIAAGAELWPALKHVVKSVQNVQADPARALKEVEQIDLQFLDAGFFRRVCYLSSVIFQSLREVHLEFFCRVLLSVAADDLFADVMQPSAHPTVVALRPLWNGLGQPRVLSLDIDERTIAQERGASLCRMLAARVKADLTESEVARRLAALSAAL